MCNNKHRVSSSVLNEILSFLYNCPSVLAQHTESSSRATKGKCPGESLETREGFREESREEFRVESREEFIALNTGEWQPVMAQ